MAFSSVKVQWTPCTSEPHQWHPPYPTMSCDCARAIPRWILSTLNLLLLVRINQLNNEICFRYFIFHQSRLALWSALYWPISFIVLSIVPGQWQWQLTRFISYYCSNVTCFVSFNTFCISAIALIMQCKIVVNSSKKYSNEDLKKILLNHLHSEDFTNVE